MGYTTRNNGQITDFWPDDDDSTLWIEDGATLFEIQDRIHEKWGENMTSLEFRFTSEYVHTQCLGYDRYDPTDYTRFLRISLVK